tara:strand:+ start:3011 stop:3385 length:375 start_codon:yes stop_codon:yes gene_type:complete
MKNLLVITLFFLSSTIYSQSILSWFKPVEEYSCKCDSFFLKVDSKWRSCSNSSLKALIFQEGRRLEFTDFNAVEKVKLVSPPSRWEIKEKGLIVRRLTFDSITKEAILSNSGVGDFKYFCKKIN